LKTRWTFWSTATAIISFSDKTDLSPWQYVL
jgi:hypothetical protein